MFCVNQKKFEISLLFVAKSTTGRNFFKRKGITVHISTFCYFPYTSSSVRAFIICSHQAKILPKIDIVCLVQMKHHTAGEILGSTGIEPLIEEVSAQLLPL